MTLALIIAGTVLLLGCIGAWAGSKVAKAASKQEDEADPDGHTLRNGDESKWRNQPEPATPPDPMGLKWCRLRRVCPSSFPAWPLASRLPGWF